MGTHVYIENHVTRDSYDEFESEKWREFMYACQVIDCKSTSFNDPISPDDMPGSWRPNDVDEFAKCISPLITQKERLKKMCDILKANPSLSITYSY